LDFASGEEFKFFKEFLESENTDIIEYILAHIPPVFGNYTFSNHKISAISSIPEVECTCRDTPTALMKHLFEQKN